LRILDVWSKYFGGEKKLDLLKGKVFEKKKLKKRSSKILSFLKIS